VSTRISYAVELHFDEATESKVRAVWKAIADAGVSTSMLDGISRPHITLGVCDELSTTFKNELSHFARDAKNFDISLSYIGSFNSAEGVVFYGPTPTDVMFRLHTRFHSFFSEHAGRIWKNYLPGMWVPHCTLAFRLNPEQLRRAFDIAAAVSLPIAGKINEVGLLSGIGGPEKELVSYEMG
jgi:2'-5' RNA ligase